MNEKIIKKQQVKVSVRKDTSAVMVSNDASSPPIWLVSFTDVIALMLTFFVLLYSMSNPDVDRWENKLGVSTSAYGQYMGARNNAGTMEGESINRLSFEEAENLDYLEILFADIASDKTYGEMIDMSQGYGFLILGFETEMDIQFTKYLNKITPFLNSLDNQLTLAISGENDAFKQMQFLGRLLKENGYDKKFNIMVTDTIVPSGKKFAILVEPYTGRRITR